MLKRIWLLKLTLFSCFLFSFVANTGLTLGLPAPDTRLNDPDTANRRICKIWYSGDGQFVVIPFSEKLKVIDFSSVPKDIWGGTIDGKVSGIYLSNNREAYNLHRHQVLWVALKNRVSIGSNEGRLSVGTVSVDQSGKTLQIVSVDNAVVSQTSPVFLAVPNTPKKPIIASITPTPVEIDPGDSIDLAVSAEDPDKYEYINAPVTFDPYPYPKGPDSDYKDLGIRAYRWAAHSRLEPQPIQEPLVSVGIAGATSVRGPTFRSVGGFSQINAKTTTWTAPSEPGDYRVSVSVQDAAGQWTTKGFDITVIGETEENSGEGQGEQGAPLSSFGTTVVEETDIEKVWVSSNPGDDKTYFLGDTVEISVKWKETVNGENLSTATAPTLKIKMDPDYGVKKAKYVSGIGTATLLFKYTVVQPNYSPKGIAIVKNSIELNGSRLVYGTGNEDADINNPGLDHQTGHKINWQNQPIAGVEETDIEKVWVSSNPGDDKTYFLGDTVEISVKWKETVNGENLSTATAPTLKIKMDPDYGVKKAKYVSGIGTATLLFKYTVVQPNYSPKGIAIVKNSIELNGSRLVYGTGNEDADINNPGLDHQTGHKINWQNQPIAGAPSKFGSIFTTWAELKSK